MDFEVDHPSISVSLGRSVVPTSASFPVVPSSACGGTDFGWNEAVTASGATETGLLTRLRVYIEATRRMELSLDEQSSKMAEDDFVKTRQQGQEVTVSLGSLFAQLDSMCTRRGLVGQVWAILSGRRTLENDEIMGCVPCLEVITSTVVP